MKTVKTACGLLFFIFPAACATEVRNKHKHASQSAVATGKQVLIEKVTGLIPSLAKIIVQYDPRVPIQWLPLIDDSAFGYQDDGGKKWLKKRLNFAFQWIHWDRKQLKIAPISACNGGCCTSDSDMISSEEMVNLVRSKLGQSSNRSLHLSFSYENLNNEVIQGENNAEFDIITLYHLQSFLERLKIVWVHCDSQQYRCAVQQSLLMLNGDVGIGDVCNAMTTIYISLKNKPGVRNEVAQNYIKAYESSDIPPLSQHLYEYYKGGMVPIFCQLTNPNLKRKR